VLVLVLVLVLGNPDEASASRKSLI